MRVAKIYTFDGHEFVTNDYSEESLAKLEGVERVEMVEMSPMEFFNTPATPESARFFAALTGKE